MTMNRLLKGSGSVVGRQVMSSQQGGCTHRAISTAGGIESTPLQQLQKNSRHIPPRRTIPLSSSHIHSHIHQPIPSFSNFSTAAMPQEISKEEESIQSTKNTKSNPTPKKKRKPIKKRNPLIITPTAASRIQFLIDQHNNKDTTSSSDDGPAVGIQLGTKKRGCNGLSYTLNYAYSNHLTKHKRDECMTISLPNLEGDGLKVYVEPMALMNVIGTTMDYVDDEMSSEFIFTNPNSKGECGCGESFNV